MTFLTPLAFALLALIPPIIALYLLKLRRQDHLVSSTYLWQRFVRDVEANAPWQKLRRNLLLFLQILLLLLLILALARPATQAEGVAGQTLILILDTSASMAATDVDAKDLAGFVNLSGLNTPTRLDAAIAAAREMVTNLPDDARVTVLAAAGGQVETLVSASQDRRQVLNALDSLQVTAQNSDLSPALTLAEALVARESRAEIVLLSDGAAQLPAQLSAPVRFIPLGRSAANQAISTLSITPARSLFAQVSNYSNQPVQRRLVIQVDESPFTAFDLDIPAGGHVEQLVESIPTTAQSVTASLSPSPTDFLPLDDRAWAVVRSGAPAQTTLVTTGNFFLQTVLSLLNNQRIGPQIELALISPEDWKNRRVANNSQPSSLPTLPEARKAQPSNSPTFQPSPLTIFDSYTPDALPPGNLLFIAPPSSLPGLFEVLGQASSPLPQPAMPEHPLLRNLTLAETQILTTAIISATSWSQTIVSSQLQSSNPSALQPSNPIPLLLAGEVEGRRVVILPFALQQSDLPLRPAFPILVANLVSYLAPGAAILLPVDVAPGDAPSLTVPAEVSQVRLSRPNGAETDITAEAGRVKLPPLTQPRLYRLSFEPDDALPPALLAVNFFNPRESTIAPQPDLALGGSTTTPANATPLPPAYQEWWRPLVVGGLILLVIEWLVYHRSKVLKWWHSWPRPVGYKSG